jgi:hypothetical protein
MSEKKTRHVYSHSDQKTLGLLIQNLDKKGILLSPSRDAGMREAKNKLWNQIWQAFNTQTEHDEPFPIWSLKVIRCLLRNYPLKVQSFMCVLNIEEW